MHCTSQLLILSRVEEKAYTRPTRELHSPMVQRKLQVILSHCLFILANLLLLTRLTIHLHHVLGVLDYWVLPQPGNTYEFVALGHPVLGQLLLSIIPTCFWNFFLFSDNLLSRY